MTKFTTFYEWHLGFTFEVLIRLYTYLCNGAKKNKIKLKQQFILALLVPVMIFLFQLPAS